MPSKMPWIFKLFSLTFLETRKNILEKFFKPFGETSFLEIVLNYSDNFETK